MDGDVVGALGLVSGTREERLVPENTPGSGLLAMDTRAD
jgi:hypothetical protein